MANNRTLCDVARARIEALEADGFRLSHDDIVCINALGWEIQTPSRRMSLARGEPFKCGNVWLWPLTVSSAKWFDEIGCEFKNHQISLAYAMARYSRKHDDIWQATQEHVNEFEKRIDATPEEITIAIDHILNSEKQDETPLIGEGNTIEEMAAIMFSSHGGSLKMWEEDCSIGYVLQFYDTINKQNEAESRSTQKDRANMALAYYCHRIRRRKKTNG